MYKHVSVRPRVLKISSLNANKGLRINDLEATLLCVQRLIQAKIAEDKKGIVLFKDTTSEYKMSFVKLQGMVKELWSCFAVKGCMSFGICGDCKKFNNSCSDNGSFGYCKNQQRHFLDSCEQHSKFTGGHGL